MIFDKFYSDNNISGEARLKLKRWY